MNRAAAGEKRRFFFQTKTLRVVRSGWMGMNRSRGLLWMASAPSRQKAQPSPSSTSSTALESRV